MAPPSHPSDGASAPTGPALGASATSAPIPYKSDGGQGADPPWAGVALLLLLAVVAVWLRWQRRRVPHGDMTATVTHSLAGWLGRRGGHSAPGLRTVASVALGGVASVHEVHWHGRRLLIGVSGTSAPTLLAEEPAAPHKDERPSEGAGE
jgi:hypothetical protein